MLYTFLTKPAQSTWEISPWLLPEQGGWKTDFTSAVLLVFVSCCVQLQVCTLPYQLALSLHLLILAVALERN